MKAYKWHIGLGLLLCNFMIAQTVEVKYYQNRLIKDPEKMDAAPDFIKNNYIPNIYSFTLSYSDGISTYKNDELSNEVKQMLASQQHTDTKELVNKDVDKVREKFDYKNMHSGEFLSKGFSGNKNYSIKDKLFDFNWQISDEVKVIEGYSCRKAMSTYLGYYFVAWYAEDLPINAGPDIYDGLPGLILYAKSLGAEFVAYAIQFSDKSIEIDKPILGEETVTFIELEKIQQNFARSFKPSESITKEGNTTTTRRSIRIEN